MIRAGVDVVRLNFSHGKAQDHIERAALVRSVAADRGREVAIMADLQGPKIRVGKFEERQDRTRARATQFMLDAGDASWATSEHVGLDYKDLPRDVRAGRRAAAQRRPDRAGGRPRRRQRDPHHGAHRRRTVEQQGHQPQGGGLTAPALTAKDMEDIKTAMRFQADYLAVSFPKNATDMVMARQLANIAGEPIRPQAADDREDRARRSDSGAAGNPRRVRRHHGRARRPGGRSRQCRGAGAAEAHDPHGARRRTSWRSPRPR